MPFTLAHPALILPFKYANRKLFSFTGLVIGSMVPDFEGFIRRSTLKNHGHTWPGALWFDFPLALIIAFVFHDIVRDSLVENLPHFLKRRFYYIKGFNWNRYFRKNYLVIISSIWIGIASHLLWDGFTHANTPLPLEPVYKIGAQWISTVSLLQFINSLVGLVIISIALIKLPSHTIPASKPIYLYWLIALVVLLITSAVKIKMHVFYAFTTDVFYNVFTGNCFLALLITSLLYKIKSLRFIF